MIDRPKFREMSYEKDRSIPEKYDVVQLKMDGMWGCLKISMGQWAIYSRTGQMKADGVLENHSIDIVMVGEFIKSSHWGHKMGLDGNFYAFDVVELHGMDLTDRPYAERLAHCGNFVNMLSYEWGWLYILTTYKVGQWQELWDNYVHEKGYEGLVFKDSGALYHDKHAWARIKNTVEIDYICVGFRPADEKSKYAGQVGAVIGTLLDKEDHVTCGGLSEEMRNSFTEYPERYIGQVFTAKGNNWYPTGAIRHPIFKIWRDDKDPEECVYGQIPKGIRCLV